MATISNAIVSQNIRDKVFAELNINEIERFTKVSNQSYYTFFVDENGAERIAEVRIIVKEPCENAEGIIEATAEKYTAHVAEMKAKAEAKREEALRKRALREAKLAEREAERKGENA